jgi:hypothetical protein
VVGHIDTGPGDAQMLAGTGGSARGTGRRVGIDDHRNALGTITSLPRTTLRAIRPAGGARILDRSTYTLNTELVFRAVCVGRAAAVGV